LHLTELDKQITALSTNEKVKLDDYTRSHLQDMQERIKKALTIQLSTGVLP
jgi:hypothetical protein